MSLGRSMQDGYSLLESIDTQDNTCNTVKHEVHQLIFQLEKTATSLRKQLHDHNKHILLGSSTNNNSRLSSKERLVGWSKRFITNILWITFIWQIINIAVLMIVCSSDPGAGKHRNGQILFGYYGLVVIQIISTIGVLAAAGRLTKQVVIHESISGWFLSQCYLATVLSFTGLYILTYRLDPHGWDVTDLDNSNDIGFIIKLYLRFLHLSSSTATLCGISNITPAAWYNYLASTVQMLLSFTYFASILGKIIGSYQPDTEQQRSSISGFSRKRHRSARVFTINDSLDNNNSEFNANLINGGPRPRSSSLDV